MVELECNLSEPLQQVWHLRIYYETTEPCDAIYAATTALVPIAPYLNAESLLIS